MATFVAGEHRPQEGEGMTVAVKALKGRMTQESANDFLREVATASSFEHKNILALTGVILQGNEKGLEGSLCSFFKGIFSFPTTSEGFVFVDRLGLLLIFHLQEKSMKLC